MPIKNQAFNLPVYAADTGLTLVSTISKDGAAFASSGTVTETGSGWYDVALTATDMDATTIAVKCTATGITVNILIETETATPTAVEIRQEIDANSTKLDVAVSTRLADADYVLPDNTGIGAITAKLPSAGAKMAGEGATAKNLDQVAVDASAVSDAVWTRVPRTLTSSFPMPTVTGVLGADELASEDMTAIIEAEDSSATFTLDELNT